MAGMLPGVECARRRRFHQSGMVSESLSAPSQGWTRRSSFCLYTSNHEKSHHLTSNSFLNQRSMLSQEYQDDHKLGVEAREAKERLDERLRTQRKSQPKRNNNFKQNEKPHKGLLEKGEKVVVVQKEAIDDNKRNVSSNKKSSGGGSRRFLRWARLSWKSSEQEECAICLERFTEGQTLVHLPCAHRFHNSCLLPWLETNAYCPFCRLGIVS